MDIKNAVKRTAATAAIVGLTTAALITGSAASASASSIRGGYVQLCAQGDYSAYITFPNRGGWASSVVSPGNCWTKHVGGSSEEPIYVYNANGSYIATEWYNGSASGIGIGTEGYGGTEYILTR